MAAATSNAPRLLAEPPVETLQHHLAVGGVNALRGVGWSLPDGRRSSRDHKETNMRIDWANVVPAARTAMLELEKVVHGSDLDPRLVELVKIRASQINGCAHCLEMHTATARAQGEELERLDLVAAWPEAGCFTEPERAALAWCEAVTLIADSGAPDDVYDEVSGHFRAEQIVALTLAIAAINTWNRLNVALRVPTGERRAR